MRFSSGEARKPLLTSWQLRCRRHLSRNPPIMFNKAIHQARIARANICCERRKGHFALRQQVKGRNPVQVDKVRETNYSTIRNEELLFDCYMRHTKRGKCTFWDWPAGWQRRRSLMRHLKGNNFFVAGMGKEFGYKGQNGAYLRRALQTACSGDCRFCSSAVACRA